jgi:cobyrinic acid a,c-diamide synthase
MINSVMIAGTNSGCGKTTITLGIMYALSKKGLKVQPFKVGPDYIDTMFQSFATKRKSRNLDSYLLKDEFLEYIYSKNLKDADIGIIEGVMGFFDGVSGEFIKGSSAFVAKKLGIPVILVIDVKGMSNSVLAVIEGFKEFNNKDWNIKGVILNNISSIYHYELLKESIDKYFGNIVIGYLKKNENLKLKSRHLGLAQEEKIHNLKDKFNLLYDETVKGIDLEKIIKISKEAKNIEVNKNLINLDCVKNTKIAVAKDKAFNFYYQDNLDLLEDLGCEISFFSPIVDKNIPDNINGIYIGGGYPELFSKELSENISLKDNIKKSAFNKMPIYAECGGLLYMLKSLKPFDDKTYEMTGIIDGIGFMTNKLKRFGYVEIEALTNNLIFKKGEKVKAHEFHYSDYEINTKNYTYYVKKKNKTWNCGYVLNNVLAAYPHIHFYSNLNLVRNFILKCSTFRYI